MRPSKPLQDALSSLLKWNEEFVMIDDQKFVYETKNVVSINVYATKLSGDFRKTKINNLFKVLGSF